MNNSKEIQAGTAAIKANVEAVKKQGEVLKVTTGEMDTFIKSYVTARRVSSTLSSAMEDLKKRYRETTSNLKKSENQNDKYSDSVLEVEKKIHKLSNRMISYYIKVKKAEKINKTGTKEYIKNNKTLKNTIGNLKLAEHEYRELTASIKENIEGMENLKNVSEKIDQAMKKLSSSQYIESGEDFNKSMQDRIDGMKEYLELQLKSGKISEEEASAQMALMKSWETRESSRQEMMQYSTDEEKEQLAAYEKMKRLREVGKEFPGVGAAKTKKEMEGGAGKVVGGAKGIFEARGVMGKIGAVKELGKSVQEFKAMREGLLGVDKGASGFLGTLGALTKAFGLFAKMNWIALIISSIVALGKAVNEVNKFVTQYNKSFVKMYGPTIALKNVRESMKEFTASVFDMNRNLKYGLKAEDVMGVFEAISQGGMSLAGVGSKVAGGYNKVIEQSVKLSWDFGVTMEEAGKMMSEQMLELRMSLNDVDTAFKSISYDATTAGIKSERFYEAISAATMSLGTYGKYLDKASALLREMYKTGALGFKDASAQASDFMNMFKDASLSQRQMFIGLTGGYTAWHARAVKLAEQSEKKVNDQQGLVDELQAQFDKMDEATPGYEMIKKRLEAEQNTLKNERANLVMIKKAATGTEQDLVALLGYMSEAGPDTFLKMLQGLGDVFGKDMTFIMQKFITDVMGRSQKSAEDFIKMMNSGLEEYKRAADEYNIMLSKMPDLDQKKREALAEIIDRQVKQGKFDVGEFEKNLKESGAFTADQIKRFSKLNMENVRLLVEVLKSGGLSEEKIKEIFQLDIAEPLIKTEGESADETNKRLNELIMGTRSFEDWIGIGKQTAEYLRSLALDKVNEKAQWAAIATAGHASKIARLVEIIASGKEAKMSEAEFKQSQQWLDMIALTEFQVKLQKKLLRETEKGDKADKGEVKRLNTQIAELDKNVEEVAGEFAYLTPEAKMAVDQRNTMIDTLEAEKKTATPERATEIENVLAGIRKVKTEAIQPVITGGAQAGIEKAREEKMMLDKVYEVFGNTMMTRMEMALTGLKYEYKAALVRESKSKKVLTPPAPPNDWETKSAGNKYLREGELVIDKKKVAKGLAGGKGQFLSKLGGSVGSVKKIEDLIDSVILKMAHSRTEQFRGVNVPLTVNIGTINGDADDLLKKLGPAVAETFNRMFFERDKGR